MQTKVRIKDIAKHCGVSTTAVSLVLNNRKGVSEETRGQILSAIDQFEFRPSAAARRLGLGGRGGTGLLGLVAFDAWADANHSYYGQLLTGASLHAQELGPGISFFQVADSTDRLPAKLDLSALDGLLLTGTPTPAIMDLLERSGKPRVLVSPSTPHLLIDSVRPENIESSWLATRHLIELGHRRIAYLGGSVENTDAQERHLGYRMALQQSGLAYDESLVEFADFPPPGGCRAMEQVLARASDVTAVFAGGDYLAIGAHDAAFAAGLSIPEDLSIVGFDDIEPVQYLRPALTTVHINPRALGDRAVDRLMQTIAKPQPPLHTRVPGDLVVRASTRGVRSMASRLSR